MANLRELRTRIKSVQSTQKITRAMQMVAGAKLRRAQDELLAARPYGDRLEAITGRYFSAYKEATHPLVQSDEATTTEAPVGVVIITSDTGLCGTYNERVLDQARAFLTENPSAKVVAVGKKVARFLAKENIQPAQSITDWSGRFDLDKVTALSEWAQEQYLSGEVSGWYVIYTQFVSALSFKPVADAFLPIERVAEDENAPDKIITEPSVQRVTDQLVRRFVQSKFQRMVLEALTSEHSARMLAMRSATDNATEMIQNLTLVMNRARQAAITTELMEVVSGAEALNG